MSRPSWFDVSFGNDLGNQLLAFTQAYQIGTKLKMKRLMLNFSHF